MWVSWVYCTVQLLSLSFVGAVHRLQCPSQSCWYCMQPFVLLSSFGQASFLVPQQTLRLSLNAWGTRLSSSESSMAETSLTLAFASCDRLRIHDPRVWLRVCRMRIQNHGIAFLSLTEVAHMQIYIFIMHLRSC